MTRGSLRDLFVHSGAAAVLAPAAAPRWASPVSAHGDGCAGVTVVVDSGEGEAALGCAADPASGLEALTQAGFAVIEVGSFPGAVCRIDDFPETDCGPMPPADASWSYWYADADGEWAYSSVGAHMRDPDEGDVEGWVFGSSEPPGIAPDEAIGEAGTADDTSQDDASQDGADEDGASGDDAPGGGGFPTWVLAVVALALIAGLIAWRLRRDRRA